MKLEIRGVNFSYDSRPVLEDVTMSVDEGNVVSLVGPNGSGKTTLLKCINKILKPKKGVVLVEEKDVREMKLKELAKLLGYVPQISVSSFPSTVFDTVLLGRRPYINWSVSPKDREIASQTLALMGIEDLALRHLNELSGGERQKVIIARALAQEPQVILLDEPTSNLDIKHQLEVLGIIRSVVKKKRIAALIAIHDLNLASRFSDKIILLHKGKIYDAGEPAKVLTQENIRIVYGVEVEINNSGTPYIIPLTPVN
ncbi:ABC transporter ATP-binding protein [Candidatus Bathyarchaeota archaeon]|nr:MAG: ABC transporter ATP-binding protein [Candidatus Bathyarchaeota archaeon]